MSRLHPPKGRRNAGAFGARATASTSHSFKNVVATSILLHGNLDRGLQSLCKASIRSDSAARSACPESSVAAAWVGAALELAASLGSVIRLSESTPQHGLSRRLPPPCQRATTCVDGRQQGVELRVSQSNRDPALVPRNSHVQLRHNPAKLADLARLLQKFRQALLVPQRRDVLPAVPARQGYREGVLPSSL